VSFLCEVVEHWLTRRHPTNGSQSRILKLKCGHTLRRKQSQGIPWHAKCHDCIKEAADAAAREVPNKTESTS